MKIDIEETAKIISHLSAYGKIHTVKNIHYPAGTHEEFINRAERWLSRYSNKI